LAEFAAAAAPDAESVLVARGLADFSGLVGLALVGLALVEAALLVAVGDFTEVLVALAALPVCFALLGVALTLRVLPPALAAADEVASVGEPDPDVVVGVGDGDGFDDGVGVLPAVGCGVADVVGTVLGVGAAGALVVLGVGVGDLELDGGGGELDWDFKSSHCWLAPVTTDAICADTAAEALDVLNWSAEAAKE
jgi:hypothetical protein